MEIEKFLEYGVHFDNFRSEQLADLLDEAGIEDLPDSHDRRLAVEALGQYLVGNRNGAMKIFQMSRGELDRQHFVDTWFSVIKDPRTLQLMGQYIARNLIT